MRGGGQNSLLALSPQHGGMASCPCPLVAGYMYRVIYKKTYFIHNLFIVE